MNDAEQLRIQRVIAVRPIEAVVAVRPTDDETESTDERESTTHDHTVSLVLRRVTHPIAVADRVRTAERGLAFNPEA